MRAVPAVIGWLQRALQHEFAATRQFALQAAVARRRGDEVFARFCTEAAAEEVEHAQRLAAALDALGAGFGSGAAPHYPVGVSRAQMVTAAIATESAAVALYAAALRAAAAGSDTLALLRALHAEESEHLQKLRRWHGGTPAAQAAPHRSER